MAAAAVVARQAEIQDDALGVTDVEISIGLGREAGDDRRQQIALHVPATGVRASGEILIDDAAQKVGGDWRVAGFGLAHGGAATGAASNARGGLSESSLRDRLAQEASLPLLAKTTDWSACLGPIDAWNQRA
ncbi:hypothetical protein D9M72_166820 [compost metagenome]